MYRYSVDNAITYISEDFVLFKESPFACWMERLTLENPEHGIPPDVGSNVPRDSMEPQDDLADTLRAEGKNVVLVDWEMDEPVRRTATLEAMRHGADFIVNGQLALGSLSGSANLLMRTSGYSELGNYLYVPCNTQPKTTMHSALRLCFLADLLHSLQGQLPPQMLIIRGGSDVVPLQTEDHIYHYRAVKQRFMAVQQAFRKHKMPDPAESSHFGRWGDCANEVLKQRALRKEEATGAEEDEQPVVYEQLQVGAAATAYDLDEVGNLAPAAQPGPPKSGGTLVEQARMLGPAAQPSAPSAGHQVDTLQNLAFIGSSSQAPTIGQGNIQASPREPVREPVPKPKPKPVSEQEQEQEPVRQPLREPAPDPLPEFAPQISRAAPPPSLRNPGVEPPADTAPVMEKSHPLDSPGFQRAQPSMVDRDNNPSSGGGAMAPPPALSNLPASEDPVEQEASTEETEEVTDGSSEEEQFLGRLHVDPFNSSLITGADSDGEER